MKRSPGSLEVTAAIPAGCEQVLSAEALAFVAGLVEAFGARRAALLRRRAERQARFDAGDLPDFLADTAEVRAGDWRCAPAPAELLDRRVEITGPVDRKMVINALNSGANVFMADFEDSNAPTWENCIRGQQNLIDAVRRTIRHDDPRTGKHYALNERTAVLFVRPRGWHLPEKHLRVAGEPAPASLVDFGLFFFHNARELVARGTAPYFYLPKLESHLEARLWNDVFTWAQAELGLPRGTIKATVLIETLPAAFEMDEILHELREHSAGLNCGRWDYIFSFLKVFRGHADRVLPDRAQVTMNQPFMRAYSQLLIRTCHRRGVHAMGGMAAQIPRNDDPEANRAALDKVREDKLREVTDGHDGTWVAHPGLVEVARAVFDEHLRGPNQLHVTRDDVHVRAEHLLATPTGTRSEAGLRQNVDVGLQYLEAWLRGAGCVPLYHLMEDAATAEISRTQVWHWVRHGAALYDGRRITPELVRGLLAHELERLRAAQGPERFARGRWAQAHDLFLRLCVEPSFTDFLTLPAYELLDEPTTAQADGARRAG
ncbi:MAG: malate synthase A [Planctomycetes bacterium]|nr:malate synthase A [Planctomycetota bacterium]